MEPHRLELRYREVLRVRVSSVLRDHHASMPGTERDRPGWDRVQVTLPDGRSVVLDVWSTAGQDITKAPEAIDLYDAGEMVCWRAPEPGA
jgi:hypothetical protein